MFKLSFFNQVWQQVWWLVLGIVGLGICSATPAWAMPPVGNVGDVVFQDGFNTGMRQWQVERGSADMWQVLEWKIQGSVLFPNSVAEIVPRPEVWNPAWRNYELGLMVMSVLGNDWDIVWGYQDSNNWYQLHFETNFLEVSRVQHGVVTWSKKQPFVLNTLTYHYFLVRTTGGNIDVWVDNALVLSTTDPTYDENPGRIALRVSRGLASVTQKHFVSLSVKLVADARDVNLNVLLSRQDDAAWAKQIYDHAPTWAGEAAADIKRWGCALTSAVMVLRYYGFTLPSDTQSMRPDALNAWLLTQPDGYVGSGSVNWLALVRLAKEARQRYSTLARPLPQLQYAYRGWNTWSQGQAILEAELRQHRPVILQLPGHFIVARGFISNVADGVAEWLIRDPASAADKLSQLNKPVLSARTFLATTAPDLVDLSYWLVVVKRGLRVRVFDDQNHLVTGWQVGQDMPGGDADAVTVAAVNDWIVLTLPQPPTGHFRLEVSRATGNAAEDGGAFPTAPLPTTVPFELQLYHYDLEAKVTAFKESGSISQEPMSWQFFTGDATGQQPIPPSLKPEFTWQDWRTSLRQVAGDKKLPRFLVARLDQVAELAQASEAQLMGMVSVGTGTGDAALATTHSQLNHRYAAWLKNLLDQASATWQSLSNAPEFAHLQNQLQQWLEGGGVGP